jgi:hypothetical protein
MRAVSSRIFGHDLKHEGVSSGSNLGRQSTNGRLMTALIGDTATRCTEWRRHGRYSGEVARGLRWAFLNEVWPYGGGAGRRTHLRGSWVLAATRATRVTGCPSSSSSATVRASSDGAPARPTPPPASPWSPQAPPRIQLWWATAMAKAVAQFGSKIHTI